MKNLHIHMQCKYLKVFIVIQKHFGWMFLLRGATLCCCISRFWYLGILNYDNARYFWPIPCTIISRILNDENVSVMVKTLFCIQCTLFWPFGSVLIRIRWYSKWIKFQSYGQSLKLIYHKYKSYERLTEIVRRIVTLRKYNNKRTSTICPVSEGWMNVKQRYRRGENLLPILLSRGKYTRQWKTHWFLVSEAALYSFLFFKKGNCKVSKFWLLLSWQSRKYSKSIENRSLFLV